MMKKCVFLDRDGVINVDNVNYTYKVEDFIILDGVCESLKKLKEAGYLLIVITNQSGIDKGIYGHEDVNQCHNYFQKVCGNLIDAFYYSPYHHTVTASLTRKPGTLMFEKAIAKFKIDTAASWMIGDRERDLVPAKKLGMKTILLPEDMTYEATADYKLGKMAEAVDLILK